MWGSGRDLPGMEEFPIFEVIVVVDIVPNVVYVAAVVFLFMIENATE